MANPFPDKDQKHVLITFLRMIGAVQVEVLFQGGGDSGEIEEARAYDKDTRQLDISTSKLDWTVEKEVFKDGEWVRETVQEFVVVKDILRSATETMLENEGLDWYNNDGGQGVMRIDLTAEPPVITLEVGINYTRTDDHEFDYTDYEEKEDAPTPSR
jgi:hypothetical protein